MPFHITRSFRALLLFGFLFGLLLFGCGKEKEADTKTEPTQSESRDSLTISLTGRDSTSVFTLLNETHQVDFASSSMGIFVKGIDSVTNGSDVFWMYSVNDSMGQVASDKYITRNGDRIIWHFKKMSKRAN